MNTDHAPRYSIAHTGSFESLLAHRFQHPAIGRPVPGKLFLREPLRLTGAEISLNRLPPGAAVPFLHRHRLNEEIYLVLGGEGEFQVDGALIPVQPGSVLRIDPPAARSWRAVGPDPLDYVVIQVPAGGYEGRGAIEDGVMLDEPPRWAR